MVYRGYEFSLSEEFDDDGEWISNKIYASSGDSWHGGINDLALSLGYLTSRNLTNIFAYLSALPTGEVQVRLRKYIKNYGK